MSARPPYLSVKEMQAIGRLFGAMRPARLASVTGCEVFAAGIHRGVMYTIDDLDAMVANFKRARGRVDPSLSIGHEEQQPLASGVILLRVKTDPFANTGTPAVGWVTKLYRRGAKLLADFEGIPRTIARLINARAYRKVSAEVYDEPPEGAPPSCRGKMLRRVALLGAELPQIKSLADLPLAEYSDRPAHGPAPFASGEGVSVELRPWVIKRVASAHFGSGAGRVTYFAEGGVMDRAALEAQLKAVGYSDLTIEALKPLSDADFANFVLAALADEAKEAAAANGTPPPADAGAADATATTQADLPPPDQMIADLVALGYDEAELRGLTPEELAQLWQEEKGTAAAPMAEPVATPAATPAPMPAAQPGAAAFAEQVWRLLRPRIAAEVAPLKKDIRSERVARLAAAREARHRTVRSFCERMVEAGKLTPAEAEFDKRGQPVGPVARRLLRADAVRKFAEAGGKTDLELQMEEVEARQPAKYGERLPDPQGQKGRGLTPERRQQLLSLTPLGRAMLRDEAKKN